MHRVARPHHLATGGLDRLDDRRQQVGDLAGAEPGDDGEPAGTAVGVERLDQRRGVGGLGVRADLDADRVVDLLGERDVGAVEGAGALADPDHVRRQVVVVAVLVAAGQRGLVLEQQRLVAGVELDARGRPEPVEVDADGRHEGDGPVDLAGDLLVALAGRRTLDEVLVPQVHRAQVGVAAGRERAHQVERRRGRVVGAQQPARVGRTGVERAGQVVDGVAAVGRQLDAVDLLDAARAGLGVLPGDAADLDHRHARAVGQDRRHLQQRLDLVADLVVGRRDERLGAVAALQQERLTARDAGQPGAQRSRTRTA